MSKDEDILEACQILINEAINNLKFNRNVQVIISNVNGDGTYNVKYHNQTITNVKGITGSTFALNDVCWAELPNNELSFIYIKTKK